MELFGKEKSAPKYTHESSFCLFFTRHSVALFLDKAGKLDLGMRAWFWHVDIILEDG